mgnify:CR=1 FL=1
MKKEVLILLFLYLIGASIIVSLYLFDIENSILYHSIFFFIVSLINLQSIRIYEEKNKISKFVIFSIVPLLIYIILILTYGNKYFLQYKNLILIPVIFSLLQIFKFVKFGKNKKQNFPN